MTSDKFVMVGSDCEVSISVGWDGIGVVGMMLGGHDVDPVIRVA